MKNPRVFIGSSSEGLKIAEAISEQIQFSMQPVIWSHNLFVPGKFPFEIFEEQLRNTDFAILVASPDDRLKKRGEYYKSMRDNILVEFGLFAGVLGRKRTFLVVPEKEKLNIPSDLLGILTASYDYNLWKNNPLEINNCIKKTCEPILAAISQESIKIQQQIEQEQTSIIASERGKSIQSLYGVAIKIREVILVIQNDFIEALLNKEKFNLVKDKAVQAIDNIYHDFKEDAQKIEVEKELFSLTDLVKSALKELPNPNELVNGENLRNILIALFTGDIVEVMNQVRTEAALIFENLKNAFENWWEKHNSPIQAATFNLQDSIFKASMNLALSKTELKDPVKIAI